MTTLYMQLLVLKATLFEITKEFKDVKFKKKLRI